MALSIREKPQSGSAKRWIIIGSIGGVFLIVLIVALVVLHIRRRKRDREEGIDIDGDEEVTGHDLENLGVTGRQGHNGGDGQNQHQAYRRDDSPTSSHMGGHQPPPGQHFGAQKADSFSSDDMGRPNHPPGMQRTHYN